VKSIFCISLLALAWFAYARSRAPELHLLTAIK
jgi:hypothetical protein